MPKTIAHFMRSTYPNELIGKVGEVIEANPKTGLVSVDIEEIGRTLITSREIENCLVIIRDADGNTLPSQVEGADLEGLLETANQYPAFKLYPDVFTFSNDPVRSSKEARWKVEFGHKAIGSEDSETSIIFVQKDNETLQQLIFRGMDDFDRTMAKRRKHAEKS